MRELTAQEVGWKMRGTETYQELTRRCLRSLVEVAPLAALDAQRPKLVVPDVKPLISSRGE
jgi:phenylacetic acid degradation protein